MNAVSIRLVWIATASLFLGQAKFFPDAMRGSGVLSVPVLVVAGVTLFELVRTVRGRRRRIAPLANQS